MTPLIARTRLRRLTPLRAHHRDEIPWRVRQQVKRRSEGMCEVCGCGGADHIHHRRLRSQGGTHDLVNLLHVHNGCHDDIHRNRARSYALGHIVPGWADPADVPVQLLPKIRRL